MYPIVSYVLEFTSALIFQLKLVELTFSKIDKIIDC